MILRAQGALGVIDDPDGVMNSQRMREDEKEQSATFVISSRQVVQIGCCSKHLLLIIR